MCVPLILLTDTFYLMGTLIVDWLMSKIDITGLKSPILHKVLSDIFRKICSLTAVLVIKLDIRT